MFAHVNNNTGGLHTSIIIQNVYTISKIYTLKLKQRRVGAMRLTRAPLAFLRVVWARGLQPANKLHLRLVA